MGAVPPKTLMTFTALQGCHASVFSTQEYDAKYAFHKMFSWFVFLAVSLSFQRGDIVDAHTPTMPVIFPKVVPVDKQKVISTGVPSIKAIRDVWTLTLKQRKAPHIAGVTFPQ